MKFQLPKLLKRTSRGFTLIELLVVIAVLGVLATIVLLAVNPAEQLARGRDSSRVSAVTQLGRALQGYYTANGATYPVGNTSWATTLVTSKDLSAVPTSPTGNSGYMTCVSSATAAAGGTTLGYCYSTTAGTETIVFARLESQLYTQKCTSGSNTIPYWVFSTSAGRAGGVCAGATDPVSSSAITFNFPT